MKQYLISALLVAAFKTGISQVPNPLKWAFTSRKINLTVYEIHLTANIDAGWHTYSQTTPDGGPVATTITFIQNPLLAMEGTTKEVGKLEKHHEPLFGVDVKQFSGMVDFVQIVKTKKDVKTKITGNIRFMVCNDKQCLPPATMNFSIALN